MKRIRFRHFLIMLLVFILGTVIWDSIRNKRYDSLPSRPETKIILEQNEVYYQLVNGTENIDWTRLDGTLEYINEEYDCSDFRLVNLIRILYDYKENIPQPYLEKIRNVLTHFRYWWDDPGENSMCYWSENHQILFASAEYLVGQLYPDIHFPNSGLTGFQHMEKSRERVLDWLRMRWDYGFIEYYSNVYYKEDIGALINLIDYSNDHELKVKSQIILDLILFDMASQGSGTFFSSVSGRAYERHRKGEAADFGGATEHLWGDEREISSSMLYGLMFSRKYSPPDVLREIARDTAMVVIRQSNGLNLTELKPEGYHGTDNRSMMMQWGMEAFTNPEVVRNSLAHIRKCNMWSNEFLSDFTTMNYKALRWLHLEPTAIRLINPQSNGVAIQKGNTYTYKTPYYSIYTVQNHHPGDFGDQQHVFGINIGQEFSIFHTHPAIEKDKEKQSPNYWVGYGHFPHSVQEKNVNLSIYNIPEKKGIMEAALLDYTHAYFPSIRFDTSFIDGNYIFGRKGDAYCVMIGANDLSFRGQEMDDLIQPGKKSFWITEAGSPFSDGNFEEFCSRIKTNKLSFDSSSLQLDYTSRGKTYQLTFGRDFVLNGEIVYTNYRRYDSPYAQAERKDSSISITCNGELLHLDFEKLIREL